MKPFEHRDRVLIEIIGKVEGKYFQSLCHNTYMSHVYYLVIDTLREYPDLLTQEVDKSYYLNSDNMEVIKMICIDEFKEINEMFNSIYEGNNFNNDDIDYCCGYIVKHSVVFLYSYIIYINNNVDFLPKVY